MATCCGIIAFTVWELIAIVAGLVALATNAWIVPSNAGTACILGVQGAGLWTVRAPSLLFNRIRRGKNKPEPPDPPFPLTSIIRFAQAKALRRRTARRSSPRTGPPRTGRRPRRTS